MQRIELLSCSPACTRQNRKKLRRRQRRTNSLCIIKSLRNAESTSLARPENPEHAGLPKNAPRVWTRTTQRSHVYDVYIRVCRAFCRGGYIAPREIPRITRKRSRAGVRSSRARASFTSARGIRREGGGTAAQQQRESALDLSREPLAKTSRVRILMPPRASEAEHGDFPDAVSREVGARACAGSL